MPVTPGSNLEAATFDLLGMIEDHPIEFTWGGLTIEGTIGGLVTSAKLESGGLIQDYALQIATSLWKRAEPGSNTLIERFPGQNASLPEEGNQLTAEGVTYRIDRVTQDDYRAGIQLDLVNVAKME